MKLPFGVIINILLFFFPVCLFGQQAEPLLFYKIARSQDCERWVEHTFSQMTLREQVAQLFVYTISPTVSRANLNLLNRVVREQQAGGLLFSGGDVKGQIELTNRAQKLAKVPLLITFDGEWGLAMRLKNTPSFPRNEVLGCIQQDSLIYEYGREVGRECNEIGVHVNFAPVADVNINPNNPVINTRSFGEDPENVARKVVAYASGLESRRVLSVCKHFPGHGDTDIDSHFALPVLHFERGRLDSIELHPFNAAVRAGVGGVMVGHLQVPSLDGDEYASSMSHKVVHDLLCHELGFKGLVFTDALAMKSVGNVNKVSVQALIAGNDVLLGPPSLRGEIEDVMDAIRKGKISRQSIERKCRKMLTYKYVLNASQKSQIRTEGVEQRINIPATASILSQLRKAAVTVVKNRSRCLPLQKNMFPVAILHVGEKGASQSFEQALATYVPVSSFRLDSTLHSGQLEVLRGQLSSYPLVIVSLTEPACGRYADFLSSLSKSVPTVYTLFVPIKSMESVPDALVASEAIVMAHSAEAEVQDYVAAVLYGYAKADGRMSVSVKGVCRVGDGVTIRKRKQPENTILPEMVGMNKHILSQIDSIALEGIKEHAYPGCQVVVLKDGQTVYDKCFGTHTYRSVQAVRRTDLYDLASLTKTTATLLAVMKLYEEGRIHLDDVVSDYLPVLKNTDKASITIRQLLLHESGLPATIPFYREAIEERSYKSPFLQTKQDAAHRIQVDMHAYVASEFRYKKSLVSEVSSENYPFQTGEKLFLHHSFPALMMKKIVDTPLLKRQYRYSDINFVLLKEVVEMVSREPLEAYLETHFYRPMGLNRLLYQPLSQYDKAYILPSVSYDFLRRSPLQGYVHDPIAAFLGGVSGNAGLFGSARDVASVYQMLLNGGMYKNRRYLKNETCLLFATTMSKISRRGLGFDHPDKRNPKANPCAESASQSVYGHTGFTGTCAWVDPENRMVFVFLSNRTWPDAWNRKFLDLNIRPRIQEVLYQSLTHPYSY